MNRRDLLTCRLADKSQPAASLGPAFYSNGLFRTQDNKPVRFYDDLIKGKIAIINFFYASCDRYCPRTMSCLAKVQKQLGDRLGRDTFMYSFTLKPGEDTPEKLKAYAKSMGARPGWLFLTGSEYDLTTIRFKLFRVDHPLIDFDLNIHASMLRIINDNNSQWTSWVLPDRIPLIMDAISWVDPLKPFDVRVRENAEQQAQINKERQALEPKWDAYKRAHGWPVVTARGEEDPKALKHFHDLLSATRA
jgi:protein SCO1/2